MPSQRPRSTSRIERPARPARSASPAKRERTAAAEPRPRDADRSQGEILEAATAEFAEFGLGGARVDRIAERAGVNKRLIYYYFGSKEDLFLAVLERTYESIRREERRLNMSEVDPIEAIRRLIAFTWNYYLAHPEFLTLLNSENLHRARHLKKSAGIATMNSPLVQMIAEALERGHKAGIFRAGVDPVQLYISIAGLAYFYLGNCHTLSAVFARDLLATKAKVERLSHMTDLVLGYLVRD
ncbi:MAG: TetR family transcriptional regulator [Betaproteobacteria bacterium]|nr:TetR family transcriptional regulator [Betaproteobacteria bacterium]